MQDASTQKRRSWFILPADDRGAAFLLAVYLVSLTLLLLSGVSLQRTTTDVRSAEVSRDLQQAFWLAEAAMDQAVVRSRNDALPDGTYADVPTAFGTATFTITTLDSKVVSPQTQRLTRQIIASGKITATGTATPRTAQVSATVTEDTPLRGMWAGGQVIILNSVLMGGPGQVVRGDIRSGLGTPKAMQLFGAGWQYQGQLQIAPPDLAKPWTRPLGEKQSDGVFIVEGLRSSTPVPLATQPAIAPMQPINPLAYPGLPADCTSSLTVAPGQTVEILDNGMPPWDRTPAGDGKIKLCLKYLYLDGFASASTGRVIFRGETTLYISGKKPGTDSAIYAMGGTSLYAVNPDTVSYPVPDTAPLEPLRIVVTKASSGQQPGSVCLTTPRFKGSIFAPESLMAFVPSGAVDPRYDIDYLVGRDLVLCFFPPVKYLFGQNISASSPASASSSFLSWIEGNQP